MSTQTAPTSSTRPRLFGTDGVRGRFGVPPLDETTVRRLGRALALELASRSSDDNAPHFVLGGDTRGSTSTLGTWLLEGLSAGGARATWLGTVPTPAIAERTRALGATCGIAISASHNPAPDNGIKLVDGAGFKWAPEAEARLEARLDATEVPAGEIAFSEPPAPDHAAVQAYLESLAGSLGDTGREPLGGLTIALDAANGAASPYAETLFLHLGARVVLAFADPDGTNINDGCGSTHPETVAELTKAHGADLGFAFDGDADRVILADSDGTVRDGDAILYLWSRALASRGELPGQRIVATSMSNLGLEIALRETGIELVRCDVGDREVVATMRREGIVLGGEQSGHLVHLGLSTTGDGLLSALQVAHLVAQAQRPLTELLAGFERFPQLIRNVPVSSKPPLETLPRVAAAWREVEDDLHGEGRLVLRYSGTEPLARIMLEGRDRETIETLADRLAEAIAAELS